MSKDRSPHPKLQALKRHGGLNRAPGKVKDPLFADSEFFDPKDLVQVKYEMLRRVQADGYGVSKASADFGLSRVSFYQAKAAFERGGVLGLVPKKRGPRGGHKLTEEIVQVLEEARAKDKKMNARGLARLVKKRFKLTVHLRSIYRALANLKKKRN